jgi:hypothetical protein
VPSSTHLAHHRQADKADHRLVRLLGGHGAAARHRGSLAKQSTPAGNTLEIASWERCRYETHPLSATELGS